MLSTVASLIGIGRGLKDAMPAGRRYLAVEAGITELASDDDRSLTPSQLADLQVFLDQQSTRQLLEVLAGILLVNGDDPRIRDDCELLRPTFEALASKWQLDHREGWHQKSTEIWEAIVIRAQAALPKQLEATLGNEYQSLSSYTQFARNPLRHAELQDNYLNRLVSLGGSLRDLNTADEFVAALSEAGGRNSMPLFSHFSVDQDINDSDLYIARELQDEADKKVSSDFFRNSHANYRAVIVGNPGAGKSTLLSHFLSESDPDGRPVILLQCREYFSISWQQSLEDALWQGVAKIYGPDERFSSSTLVNALLLGDLTVVFDGIDEITRLVSRQEFVKRVHAFASRYPLTSILVTSRETGYSNSPLDSKLFDKYKLTDFSSAQRDDYAAKWFAQIGRPELVASFLQEANSVRDISTNPLMLSLLCSLYRAQGTIPTNRRLVYRRCADLLFYQWDARRQIDQNEDLPEYGNRIMEQIAGLFYLHESAQDHVDEQQLVKLISLYLEDAAGASNAERRAAEFLEFCADRAWLLAKVSYTTAGLPVYGFTHRTFYEFFAAEAIVRSAKDAPEVARAAVSTHRRDGTSVLPELLIQAYEEKHDRGAAAVYRCICVPETPSDLLIRLMNVSMPRSVRSVGFQALADNLSSRSPGSMSRAALDALLLLHIDPREQLVNEVLLSPDSPIGHILRREILIAWAEFRLLSPYVEPYQEDLWGPVAKQILNIALEGSELADIAVSMDDPISFTASGKPRDWQLVIDNWRITKGFLSPNSIPLHAQILLPAFGEFTYGSAVHGAIGANDDIRAWLAEQWKSGGCLPAPIGKRLANSFGTLRSKPAPPHARPPNTQGQIDEISLGLFLALMECEDNEDARGVLWILLRLSMRSRELAGITAYRYYRLGIGEKPSDDLGGAARDAVKRLPSWAKAWVRGEHHLTTAS